MQELTITTQILIISACLAMLAGAFLVARQKRKLKRQREEIQRQRFALRKSRIIDEIAGRLNKSDETLSQSERAGAVHQQPTITIHPPSGKTDLRTNNQISHAPQLTIETGQNQTLHNKRKPLTGTFIERPEKVPLAMPKLLSKTQPDIKESPVRELKARPASKLILQKDTKPSVQRGWLRRQRNSETGAPPTGPFKVQRESGLYDQIREFSAWIASRSETFVIEKRSPDSSAEAVWLFISPQDLERHNGHWFNLFKPPELSILKGHQATHEEIYCPFGSKDLEEVIKPAKEIISLALKDGSSRYRQVLKESALEDLVIFLEDLRHMIATEEA